MSVYVARCERGLLFSVATAIAGILLSLLISRTLLAQAGSTRGTVGKLDKSVSGRNSQPETRREKLGHQKPGNVKRLE